MKIEILGSCGNQTATRESVGFIIETQEHRILVETGPGITRQIYRSGRKCSDIDTIIVTHRHADHSGGYAYVVWSNFYDRLGGAQGKDTINVIGLSSITEGLDRILRFCYDPDTFPFKLRYRALSHVEKSSIELGDLKITSVPVIHSTENVGLRFDYHGRSVSYSSDTLYSENFVQLARNCDLMIHEAFVDVSMKELSLRTKHATAQDAGQAARDAGTKKLALVHLFPPFIGKEEKLVEEAKKEFLGEVFVPDEFTKIALD